MPSSQLTPAQVEASANQELEFFKDRLRSISWDLLDGILPSILDMKFQIIDGDMTLFVGTDGCHIYATPEGRLKKFDSGRLVDTRPGDHFKAKAPFSITTDLTEGLKKNLISPKPLMLVRFIFLFHQCSVSNDYRRFQFKIPSCDVALLCETLTDIRQAMNIDTSEIQSRNGALSSHTVQKLNLRSHLASDERRFVQDGTRDSGEEEALWRTQYTDPSASAEIALKILDTRLKEKFLRGLESLPPSRAVVSEFHNQVGYLPYRFYVGFWEVDQVKGHTWAYLEKPKQTSTNPPSMVLQMFPKGCNYSHMVCQPFDDADAHTMTYSQAFEAVSKGWDDIYALVRYYWLRIASEKPGLMFKHYLPINKAFVMALGHIGHTSHAMWSVHPHIRSRDDEFLHVVEKHAKSTEKPS